MAHHGLSCLIPVGKKKKTTPGSRAGKTRLIAIIILHINFNACIFFGFLIVHNIKLFARDLPVQFKYNHA